MQGRGASPQRVCSSMCHHMGVSENRGTLLGGPYNKDPTI